jgi:hypothetical protein
MPMPVPPGERKYQTEFTLLVTVGGAYLLRPQDLREVDVSLLDEPACHLYVISRTPRVSIDPSTVSIGDDLIVGTMTIHERGNVEDYPFEVRHEFGEGKWTWSSEWPHEEFAVVQGSEQPVAIGVCALFGVYATGWPKRAYEHEVLYVGQAYGRAGERTAWERLQKHETLQRILADQAPDTQVWLTMATVIDVHLIQEVLPTAGRATDDEDNAHIDQVVTQFHRSGFKDREAVALAEAGLIRGWQPEYNDRLKYNFPARKQVSLEVARSLDLHGLVVEWQSFDLPANYFSVNEDPGKLAFFGYKVHLDVDRAQTLTLEALDRPLLSGIFARAGHGTPGKGMQDPRTGFPNNVPKRIQSNGTAARNTAAKNESKDE